MDKVRASAGTPDWWRPTSGQRIGGQIAIVLSALAAAFMPWVAHAQYEPPRQIVASPGGVNLADGRFNHQATDFSIGPLTLERLFFTRAINGSQYFGTNWTHNYAIHVKEGNGQETDKTVVIIGTSSVHFTRVNVPSVEQPHYQAWNPDAFGQTLELVNGAFVYTDREGNVYTFNPAVHAFIECCQRRNQRVSRIDYANGHRLDFTYNGSGQLTQIASNFGYSLVFEYGSNGYVSRSCGFNRAVTYVPPIATCSSAPVLVTYSYSSGSPVNLISVVDPAGQTWGYDYSNGQITCVRQVNSSNCQIATSYYGHWVTQQTMADGSVWNYNFVPPDADNPNLPGEVPPTYGGSYSNPDGLSVFANFTAGLLTSLTNYWIEGGTERIRTSNFTWDGIELASQAHPEGNTLTFTRDGRGNVTGETWTAKPGSGTASVSRTITYPEPSAAPACVSVSRAACNRPTARTDYRGNQTDFTYDQTHGQVLTETAPAAANGIRPQTRTTYAPFYARVLDAYGGTVQESRPIYLPTQRSSCATGAASGSGCAVSGDETVTTFEYGPGSGPSNLNLSAEVMTAGGVSQRTCHRYDWRGNRISTTQPNAGLSSCP